jgi:hypothetical protein
MWIFVTRRVSLLLKLFDAILNQLHWQSREQLDQHQHKGDNQQYMQDLDKGKIEIISFH